MSGVRIDPKNWTGESNYVRMDATRKKCGTCGCKIRGENHESGSAHQNRVKAK
jgi:hypothetical protein